MTFETLLGAATPFLPAMAYLVLVCGLLSGFGKVPFVLHPALLTGGLTVRVLQSGWQEPAAALAVAAGLFVVLVGLAARTVSGVSLFALIVTLALCPLNGWLGVVLGLFSAALMAGWRTWRTLGKSRVTWLASDTLSAMGVAPSGHLKPLQPSLIPTRDSLTDIEAATDEASRLRMYLPPYLLFGLLMGAAMTMAAG